jgi:hypothetical protein
VGTRKEKTGTELDLSIMSQCVRLLMKVPVASRRAIIQWLAQRMLVEDEKVEAAQGDLFT